ncbi:Predicted kinase [Actinopolyspora alba]|uniref:Predicted kinase n=1 Tax=Actinopolyspora alba TaxID=673379 RepID=A0A1I2B932_9ACTN|nr:Predicted kinase [Actinopolyspora alba]
MLGVGREPSGSVPRTRGYPSDGPSRGRAIRSVRFRRTPTGGPRFGYSEREVSTRSDFRRAVLLARGVAGTTTCPVRDGQHDDSASRIRVGRRDLLVVAGLPGAGKTTLLGSLRCSEPTLVLDSAQLYRVLLAGFGAGVPRRLYRAIVHPLHYARIVVACLLAPGVVVVHVPATRRTARGLLVALATITRRSPVLCWLEVSPEAALAGQRARGRMTTARAFARHVRRARLPRQYLYRIGRLRGWHRVYLLTRAEVTGGVQLVP